MEKNLRRQFNESFDQENYLKFASELNNVYPNALQFRVAETAIFVPKDFTQKMIDACESIIDTITAPTFNELTKNAIPDQLKVPNPDQHTHFIAFDFGICENENGEYEPQLIEMQGFPSLFAYEIIADDIFRKYFYVPENYSAYLGGLDKESYIQLLRETILGNHSPKNVVLLEIFPHKQKTRVDFYSTEQYVGIKTVCITELIKEGNKLYYHLDGIKTPIHRIYNRVIFDDLYQQTPDVQEKGKILFDELEVEWCPHPSWFYKISKYTLPLIQHPYVPPTFYLNKLKEIPTDLENYVLKPLFSFAGQGVIIDLTKQDIDQVKDPENWILQRKVKYADAILTPDDPAKAEIRIFYFWKDGETRPLPTNNLGRLSKGKMIGVRYNKDKEWVGGTVCYFEE